MDVLYEVHTVTLDGVAELTHLRTLGPPHCIFGLNETLGMRWSALFILQRKKLGIREVI